MKDQLRIIFAQNLTPTLREIEKIADQVGCSAALAHQALKEVKMETIRKYNEKNKIKLKYVPQRGPRPKPAPRHGPRARRHHAARSPW